MRKLRAIDIQKVADQADERRLWDRFLCFGPTNPPIMTKEVCDAAARLGRPEAIAQMADFKVFKAYVKLTS